MAQRQTLLSVHGPLARPGAVRLDGWTLLCVWNMWEPSRPQKVLVYESEVNPRSPLACVVACAQHVL